MLCCRQCFLKEAVLASKQAVQILSCYGLARRLLSQPLHGVCTAAGFEDQLGNDVNDIIDWGVQVTGSRPASLFTRLWEDSSHASSLHMPSLHAGAGTRTD